MIAGDGIRDLVRADGHGDVDKGEDQKGEESEERGGQAGKASEARGGQSGKASEARGGQ